MKMLTFGEEREWEWGGEIKVGKTLFYILTLEPSKCFI